MGVHVGTDCEGMMIEIDRARRLFYFHSRWYIKSMHDEMHNEQSPPFTVKEPLTLLPLPPTTIPP